MKRFYLRIKSRHGLNIVIMALARKVICILHHLVINEEMFEDEKPAKPKRARKVGTSSPTKMDIAGAIQILIKAGHVVQKDKAYISHFRPLIAEFSAHKRTPINHPPNQ